MTKKTDPTDTDLMNVALGLARRGIGNTAPNPAVGCILTRPDMNNRVVGRGWTQPGGRPHAETEAVSRAGALAYSATAYVTLEPCCHHGQTPPCTDALIKAGVRRVVVATTDPDARVAGQGISALREAGLEVEVGLCADSAHVINAGFLRRINDERPHVTLKVASSLDGRIATHSGQSQWITGDLARNYGHYLRARNDGILTGMGTVRADNPGMTCRLPGLVSASPTRIVLDPRLEISMDTTLIASANQTETWIIAGNGQDVTERATHLSHQCKGVSVHHLDLDDRGQLNPHAVLCLLAGQGINRVLLEAGARLNASFVAAGLIDEIYWFRAPIVIGGDGFSSIEGVCVDQLVDAPSFRHIDSIGLGIDRVEIYVAAR